MTHLKYVVTHNDSSSMHQTVMDFTRRMLRLKHVMGKRVLEVGSYDVNGSVRPVVERLQPAEYLGVDQSAGPGVDAVLPCERLMETFFPVWDLVICTEMLEHVEDWRVCMVELAGVVAPGGYLLLTTRSPGFPYHPFPVDNWRYTREQMSDIMAALNLEVVALEDDPEPGVLVFARKSLAIAVSQSPNVLEGIEIERV